MHLSPKWIVPFLLVLCIAGRLNAHVPHDIIYSLDVSPNLHEDGLVLASSTQFGEAHLVSTNYLETFSESHCGMDRTLVTGHVFSPAFKQDGTVYMFNPGGILLNRPTGAATMSLG